MASSPLGIQLLHPPASPPHPPASPPPSPPPPSPNPPPWPTVDGWSAPSCVVTAVSSETSGQWSTGSYFRIAKWCRFCATGSEAYGVDYDTVVYRAGEVVWSGLTRIFSTAFSDQQFVPVLDIEQASGRRASGRSPGHWHTGDVIVFVGTVADCSLPPSSPPSSPSPPATPPGFLDLHSLLALQGGTIDDVTGQCQPSCEGCACEGGVGLAAYSVSQEGGMCSVGAAGVKRLGSDEPLTISASGEDADTTSMG